MNKQRKKYIEMLHGFFVSIGDRLGRALYLFAQLDILSISPSALLIIGGSITFMLGHEQGLVSEEYFNIGIMVFSYLIVYYMFVSILQIVKKRTSPDQGSADWQYMVSRGSRLEQSGAEDAPHDVIRRRAIHEAAHIIALRTFTRKPDEIYAWVWGTINGNAGQGGRVHYKYNERFEQSSGDITDRMLFSITPLKAEELLLGEALAGSCGDMKNWEEAAKFLLNNFPTDVAWYRLPSTELESQTNAITLKNMLVGDLEKAAVLVISNSALISRIADLLMDRGSLSTNDIIALFD